MLAERDTGALLCLDHRRGISVKLLEELPRETLIALNTSHNTLWSQRSVAGEFDSQSLLNGKAVA